MEVSARMLGVLANAVERVGGSRDRFFRRAGLDPALAEDPTARLPLDAYLGAVNAAAWASGDPAFGLHMGEQARAAMFGVPGPLAESALSLRRIVETMVRYARLLSEGGFEPELREGGQSAAIRFAALSTADPAIQITADFVMAALASTLPLFVGDRAPRAEARFARPTPDHVAEYHRIFGERVRFGEAFVELVVPRAWLDVTQRHADSELHALLQDEAERSMARLERDASIRARVERIVEGHGACAVSMDEVARQLGMSARSLRRQLTRDGLDFGQLVRGKRVYLARRMLERRDATLQEIALAMGFSSVTSFHRAFKRWTGMTPQQYRDSY